MSRRDVLGFEATPSAGFAASCAAAEAAWAALQLPTISDPALFTHANLSRTGGLGGQRRAFWLHWSASGEEEAARAYETSLRASTNAEPDEQLAASLEQIELDVARTFPEHAAFGDEGAGLDSLRRVLRALAADPSAQNARCVTPDSRQLCVPATNSRPARSASSYVQGQNFVAAFALLALAPTGCADAPALCEAEAAAFAVCSALLHARLAPYYYSARLAALREDLDSVGDAFENQHPAAAATLSAHRLSIAALCPAWLLCAFVGAAPTEAVLRLWDALLATPPEACRAACRAAAAALVADAAASIAAAAQDASAAAAALRDGCALRGCESLCRAALAAAGREAAAAAAARSRTPPPRKRARVPDLHTPLVAAARLLSPGFGSAVQGVADGWARLSQPPTYAEAVSEPEERAGPSAAKRGKRVPPTSPEWHAHRAAADGSGAAEGGVELQEMVPASAAARSPMRSPARTGSTPVREVR